MPAVVPGFVGRVRELGELEDLVPAGPADPTRAVVISGMAGVGKTTLAVR
jgi:GTPase SAR1 family protein